MRISSVNVGAHHAALVEVLVGRSETPNEPFKVGSVDWIMNPISFKYIKVLSVFSILQQCIKSTSSIKVL